MSFPTSSILTVSGYFYTPEYTAAPGWRTLAIATGLKVQLERGACSMASLWRI